MVGTLQRRQAVLAVLDTMCQRLLAVLRFSRLAVAVVAAQQAARAVHRLAVLAGLTPLALALAQTRAAAAVVLVSLVVEARQKTAAAAVQESST